MQKNILLSIVFSLAIFSLKNLVAQEQKFFTDESIAQLFSKNHFAFKVKGLMFEKGKVVGECSPFNPSSNSLLGFEAGVDYILNKSKKTSIVTGLHFGFSPRDFTHTTPKSYFPPLSNPTFDEYPTNLQMFPLFYANIPLSIEKRIFSKNNFFFYSGGVNIKYALMFSEDSITSTLFYRSTEVMKTEMYENWKNNNNLFIQANLSFGYGFILKSNNILKVELVSNIALTNLSTVNYIFFTSMPTTQQGTYTTRAGFIGLSFSYVLTNSNKRLLKNKLK